MEFDRDTIIHPGPRGQKLYGDIILQHGQCDYDMDRWRNLLRFGNGRIIYFNKSFISNILFTQAGEAESGEDLDDGDYIDFCSYTSYHDIKTDTFEVIVSRSKERTYNDSDVIIYPFKHLPLDKSIRYPDGWIQKRIAKSGKVIDSLEKYTSKGVNISHIVRIDETRGESSKNRHNVMIFEVPEKTNV